MQVDDQGILIGAATRPYPGESINGDAWTAAWYEGICRIAVFDGVGHGPQAGAASQLALAALAARPELEPLEALHLCHQALRGSRGAVAAVATINPAAGALLYAGVGNIEARLIQGGLEQRPISYRGMLGVTMPAVRLQSLELAGDWTLILHTDGISSRFEAAGLLRASQGNVQTVAESVLAAWARAADDATIVVAQKS